MSCCEQSAPTSGCNQGRDCPVRSSRITSEQAFEAARLMDAARIQESRRVPRSTPPATDTSIPPEAGNIWFADSEPTPLCECVHQDDGFPLSQKEVLAVSGIAVCILAPWLVLIAVAVGYLAERAAA